MSLVSGPYLGPAELAEMFGVSRQRVAEIVAKPDFPQPIAVLRMGKVWRTDDVVAWAKRTGRTVKD